MNEVLGKAELLRRVKDEYFLTFKMIFKHLISTKQRTIDFGQTEVAQKRQENGVKINTVNNYPQ